MIAAVLDANTIVSAILVELGISRRILMPILPERGSFLTASVSEPDLRRL